MCQKCQQKEMGRPARIATAVIILGLGSLMIGYIAMYHDDLFRPFREHHIKVRMETLKTQGYTAIGPSISWQSEGRDIPIHRPPRFEDKLWEGPDFLPPPSEPPVPSPAN